MFKPRYKESLTLDRKQLRALEIPTRSIGQADVLVQNLAPGAATRRGWSFGSLNAAQPKLTVCDISGYGDDGSYRDKKAYDLTIHSEAGFLSVTGTPEAPSKAGVSVALHCRWHVRLHQHPVGISPARRRVQTTRLLRPLGDLPGNLLAIIGNESARVVD